MNRPTPQSWPNCDKAIYAYINGFVELLKSKLADTLVGVYLHGSLAMNSYFPPKSDMENESERKAGGFDWDSTDLLSFRDYAKNEVKI